MARPEINKREQEILDFWDKERIFEKSVKKEAPKGNFVFFDGPPFATGLPHYGHLLGSIIKDVVPRFWTMNGYRVERRWGWDCHGIPIENMIEKELDLKGGKKGIEAFGIDKFNAACRAAILRFDKEWQKTIRRIARWVDFENSYKTMDNSFMESVWWGFKTMHDNGHIYEGRRVILYCPRCATPLSNFEIAMDNSYQDVEDNSLYVKFKIKGSVLNEYFVAWTTTPWTLPGNVALVVDANADYVRLRCGSESLWVAEKLRAEVERRAPEPCEYVETKKGADLVNKEYEPLYEYMPTEGKRAYYVLSGNFVSLEDGTGIVHTAAIFGEDDYQLAMTQKLPCVPTLDDQGKFLDFVEPLKGQFYKKAEAWVIEDLTARGLILKAEKITHSYPFCYRCATPLYFNAVPAWFVDVQNLKPKLLEENEHINWYPEHLKHGRFGKGVETAPDWNISRSRFWGTPMPVWVGEKTGKQRILSSFAELKEWAIDPNQVEGLTDFHREFLDPIELWVDDAKTEKGQRINDVFDCWVESGSMPFAACHYPFENQEWFKEHFPAQFITEYIPQTRAWFYVMHVMSVGLFGSHAYEHVLTTGNVLAEDGKKMSKSKKNYPDPEIVLEKYGADAVRFYLMANPIVNGENLNFAESGVDEVSKKFLMILENVLTFYKLYEKQAKAESDHVLDRWVKARLQETHHAVTSAFEGYNLSDATRHLQAFVTDLSTWYVRRSRDRMKDGDGVATLREVLLVFSKLIAPFTPFLAE
ncbi:MAG: isoleucine--tRNA ligase, partial [Patescibacteria group bacterium]